ncbi:MCP four helix bundle domain-containing protein [Legionella spiritensis]|uniref:Chemotaxis methyl-accepting receptor HlyB-like 4HB MCP domain-containing protein n=1 Tax=Legionella spiritensis TaxID=452 RepID=A0A0W0YYJ1_LEGSP|nr:MCP four helix bundle domain-containing protein [Legionella spiritensis]KTD61896.1 hypothetical protein Lspi_2526 [Legionella spiritensis]SNV31226.1 Uncharacterised protein [Legionella spiritensis]
MKLEKKVLLTYIIFIIAFGIWGGLSIYTSRELFSLTSVLYKRPLAVTQNAYLTQKGILETNTLLFQILLKEGDDFYTEEAEIKKLDTIVNNNMKIVREKIRFAAGKQLADKAIGEINGWEKYRDSLIKQRKDGTKFTVDMFENIMANKNYKHLNKTMSHILAYAADRSDEYYFDSLDTVRKIFVLNIALIVLLILICIITAYEVYRAMKKTGRKIDPF